MAFSPRKKKGFLTPKECKSVPNEKHETIQRAHEPHYRSGMSISNWNTPFSYGDPSGPKISVHYVHTGRHVTVFWSFGFRPYKQIDARRRTGFETVECVLYWPRADACRAQYEPHSRQTSTHRHSTASTRSAPRNSSRSPKGGSRSSIAISRCIRRRMAAMFLLVVRSWLSFAALSLADSHVLSRSSRQYNPWPGRSRTIIA